MYRHATLYVKGDLFSAIIHLFFLNRQHYGCSISAKAIILCLFYGTETKGRRSVCP